MKSNKQKKPLLTALKIIWIVLLALILLFAGYVAYVLISYHRIGDQPLPVEGTASGTLETGTEYKVVSYNIGFGAYESDFGFFMDGGDRARAWSKSRLDNNLRNITRVLKETDADLYLIQEIDIGSTRSYRVDERPYLIEALDGTAYTFAQNYDSPFLAYPVTQPFGKARSGLMTFSNAPVTTAERREVPVESGFTKFLDLDRCYSKHRIPLKNGGELVLYNLHLSAYTSEGKIAYEQLEILLSDMQSEYEKGNYCIAGGDFNKDLLGDSSKYFGKSDIEYTWAQPIPDSMFEGRNITLIPPIDEANPVPSCRNADGPYHEGQYTLTIDGFLVTDNVTVVSVTVIDTGFAYSDHNPVEMRFVLN
jgi:endonuclease/exonuclease/phosphatase family metal-dependent hydrolase